MPKDYKPLLDNLLNLNKNITDNTNQLEKMEATQDAANKIQKENNEFLQNLVKTLIQQQQQNQKTVWSYFKTILDWSLRIGGIAVLLGLGFKYGPSLLRYLQ